MDFVVNGDNTAKMLFVDASADVLGVGVAAPATAYMLDVGEVGSGATGKSINAAGGADIGGNSTISGSLGVTTDLTVTSRLFLNDAIATALNGGVDASNDVEIPLTDLVTHLLPADNSHDYYGLANGTAAGQVKILLNTHATLDVKVTPASTPHVGTTLTLQAGETATMLYTTGGWMMLNYGGAMANS